MYRFIKIILMSYVLLLSLSCKKRTFEMNEFQFKSSHQGQGQVFFKNSPLNRCKSLSYCYVPNLNEIKAFRISWLRYFEERERGLAEVELLHVGLSSRLLAKGKFLKEKYGSNNLANLFIKASEKVNLEYTLRFKGKLDRLKEIGSENGDFVKGLDKLLSKNKMTSNQYYQFTHIRRIKQIHLDRKTGKSQVLWWYSWDEMFAEVDDLDNYLQESKLFLLNESLTRIQFGDLYPHLTFRVCECSFELLRDEEFLKNILFGIARKGNRLKITLKKSSNNDVSPLYSYANNTLILKSKKSFVSLPVNNPRWRDGNGVDQSPDKEVLQLLKLVFKEPSLEQFKQRQQNNFILTLAKSNEIK